MSELAEAILYKIMGDDFGYVDTEMGVFDLSVDLTDEETAYLESLAHTDCRTCGAVTFGRDAAYEHYVSHLPPPAPTHPQIRRVLVGSVRISGVSEAIFETIVE